MMESAAKSNCSNTQIINAIYEILLRTLSIRWLYSIFFPIDLNLVSLRSLWCQAFHVSHIQGVLIKSVITLFFLTNLPEVNHILIILKFTLRPLPTSACV